MNGDYAIANSKGSSLYNSTYSAEFFQVYSRPIKTRYSEVFWTMQDPIALPQHIIQRFENKVMAIVGYEVDQVRKTENGQDVSVPITHA